MTARTATQQRECECCGARFGRKRFPSGQLERASQFAKRRFCSRECYRKASADGFRVRPPGEWFIKPYELKSPGDAFHEPDPHLPGVGRYPWDRPRRSSSDVFPGQVSTSRPAPVPVALKTEGGVS